MAIPGSCLCGGVKFKVTAPLRDIIACHCSQCRKTSGNFVAATSAPIAGVNFETHETLRWYRSSDKAERGFCGACGGNLFWRKVEGDTLSIMAGMLDPPTGLKIAQHIFVADKSDFYELFDDVEKLDQW